MAALRENIRTTTLSNGIRVVSESVDTVQSISIGLWVGVGSRHEAPGLRGVTHFIEHMLFKGTKTRGARQIADEIESRGGSLNAFTDKEYTCYYAKALAEDAPIVIDVLTDMLRNSVLDPDDLAREKNVVIEEIKRSADTPEDYVHDVFAETLWSRHPLGKPTAGSVRSVSALTPDHLRDYLATHYTPDRIVVSAAGNATHEEMVDLASRALGDMGGARHQRKPRAPEGSGASRRVRRRTEQVNFCLGCPGYAQSNDDRFGLFILDAVLGGSMSSRLFQEIREKRGLAYSIGSYSVSYLEGGAFAIYGGTSPETFDEVVALSRAELDATRRGDLTVEEIAKAKTQIRGAMVLGLENMSTRMMRMGKSMVYLDRVVPLSEVLAKIDAVTMDDLGRVANDLFQEDRLTIAAVGPFPREAQESAANG